MPDRSIEQLVDPRPPATRSNPRRLHAKCARTNYRDHRQFHGKVLTLLTTSQVEQLLLGYISIEALMSFRIKQMVSYWYLTEPDARRRRVLVDLIWTGASKQGAPELARPAP